jgi:class 3 adenylate cyclase
LLAPRQRALAAFALVLAAGFMAHSTGLTLAADQAVRSILPGGLIEPPAWVAFAAALLALGGWFGRTSRGKTAVLGAAAVAVAGIGLLMARRGDFLPMGSIVLGLAFSGLARFAYDLLSDAWRTDATRAGARGSLCVMVFDVQGFVQRAETMPPEQAIALLNECFSALAAAVHGRGGSANRLLGAGAVALFGAPQTLDCPEKSALEAAQDVLEALRDIDPQIEATIGLHAGELAFGQVGGRRRQDYTAVGQVVTVAAQLQGLAHDTGDPVLCSAVVADAVGRAGGLREVGERAVAGETMTLFAWTPPLLSGQDELRHDLETA